MLLEKTTAWIGITIRLQGILLNAKFDHSGLVRGGAMSHVLLVREALMQMRQGDWHVKAVLRFVDDAELGSWITPMLQSVRLEVSSAGGTDSPTVHPRPTKWIPHRLHKQPKCTHGCMTAWNATDTSET